MSLLSWERRPCRDSWSPSTKIPALFAYSPNTSAPSSGSIAALRTGRSWVHTLCWIPRRIVFPFQTNKIMDLINKIDFGDDITRIKIRAYAASGFLIFYRMRQPAAEDRQIMFVYSLFASSCGTASTFIPHPCNDSFPNWSSFKSQTQIVFNFIQFIPYTIPFRLASAHTEPGSSRIGLRCRPIFIIFRELITFKHEFKMEFIQQCCCSFASFALNLRHTHLSYIKEIKSFTNYFYLDVIWLCWNFWAKVLQLTIVYPQKTLAMLQYLYFFAIMHCLSIFQ